MPVLQKRYMYSLSRQVYPLNEILQVMVQHALTTVTFSTQNSIKALNRHSLQTGVSQQDISKVAKKYPGMYHTILESFEQEALDADEELHSKHFRGVYHYENSVGTVLPVNFIMMHGNRIMYPYDMFFSFEYNGFFNDDFKNLPFKSANDAGGF